MSRTKEKRPEPTSQELAVLEEYETSSDPADDSDPIPVERSQDDPLDNLKVMPPALWHLSMATAGFPGLEGEVWASNKDEALREFFRQKGIVRSDKEPEMKILQGSVAK